MCAPGYKDLGGGTGRLNGGMSGGARVWQWGCWWGWSRGSEAKGMWRGSGRMQWGYLVGLGEWRGRMLPESSLKMLASMLVRQGGLKVRAPQIWEERGGV